MAVDSTSAAAATAASSNAAFDAAITAELSALAADAEALQAQITVGDVVLAQVLPSNGLTDLVSILGNRVAAVLPPTLSPGDLVTVQVTGFNGPQILMQLVANDPPAGDAEAAAPSADTAAPTAANPLPASPGALAGAAQRASGVTQGAPAAAGAGAAAAGPGSTAAVSIGPAPSQGALAAAAANPLGASEPPPLLAPPVAVFVAASVRPAAGGSPDPAAQAARPGPPAPAAAAAAGTTAASVAAIETRLAVARAGSPAGTVAGKTAGAPLGQPRVAPAIGRGFSPPPVVTPARFLAPAASASAAAAGDAAPPATLATFADPAALVRALQLPVTPTNIAAAQLALTAPQRLPAALATLERALPDIDDSRIQTLRTIAAFLAKIEPSSPELAGQIAAYVDHVVDGGDAKLVQLLAAQNAAASAAEPTVPVVAQAQAVERAAAMASDLKTQLQQLLAAPPGGASEDLVPAAATALAAVTGVQLAGAQAALAVPQQISFALPLWLGNGYTQARVAIDRDGSGAQRAPLDGDNFHIAFVLDTKNLGTVTVDLVTAGRAFSLAVKTQSSSTAKRFGDALDRLTSRLETLRYTVHSAEATVATPFTPDIAPPSAVADDDDVPATVNQRA